MNNGFLREERDLLIRMDEKLDALKISFDSHLKYHAKYNYLLLATMIGAIVSLAIALV